MITFGKASGVIQKEVSLDYFLVGDKEDKPLLVYLSSACDVNSNKYNATFDGFLFDIPRKYKDKFNIVLPIGKQWWDSDEIFNLVEQVRKDYNFTKPASVIGYSYGARGVWDVLMDYPKLFNAGIPIAGYASYIKSPLMIDVPVYAFAGNLDKTVLPIESIRAINTLKGLGNKNAFLTIFPNCNHNINSMIFRSKFIYEWLLKFS